MKLPEVGTRVKTINPIDRFPHFLIKEVGLTGTVVQNDKTTFAVKLDHVITELKDWDNCLVWGKEYLTFSEENIRIILEEIKAIETIETKTMITVRKTIQRKCACISIKQLKHALALKKWDSAYINVPSGGDYSGMQLEIDDDTPIILVGQEVVELEEEEL